METFLLVVVVVVLIMRWAINSARLRDMESRIFQLESEVRTLRSGRVPAPAPRPEPEPATPVESPPASAPTPVPVPVLARNFCPFCGKPMPPPPANCECRELLSPGPMLPPPLPPPLPIEPRPEPAPPLKLPGKDEWEALVGGQLLNKAGILLVVIGMALLLGWRFAYMGPLGRSLLALTVSLAMLAAGVFIEKREKYQAFARGLIGGGWAALYFTVYAMQAVAAAKIIDSPLLGVVLLFAVAAGMILHSLRYRSETVTGLAYFVAFATLAITSLTALSVIALIPLAASLLYLTDRFSWSRMSVFGVLATYLSCLAHGDSGAALWMTQLLFGIYWLIFEGFDLLRASRHAAYNAWDSAVFSLNAFFFCLVSWAKWNSSAPSRLYLLAAGIAALYLASALLRARMRPPSSFPDSSTLRQRLFSGGYESPIAIAAAFASVSILLKLHWEWALAAMLLEAEAFYLAGLFFEQRYLRQLAAILFAWEGVQLLLTDMTQPRMVALAGREMRAWIPVTFTSALVLYANRFLRRVDRAYGYAASATVALVLVFLAAPVWVALTLYVFAAALFAFGFRARASDFRIQAYGAGTIGLLALFASESGIAFGALAAPRYPWISLAALALMSYALVLAVGRLAPERFEAWEIAEVPFVGCFVVSALSMALVWRAVPLLYVGVGWLALGLVLLELSLRGLPGQMRKHSYAVAALGAVFVFFKNVLPIENAGPFGNRLACAAAALLAYAFAARLGFAREKEADRVIDAASASGTLFLLVGLWALLPSVAVAPAWVLVGLLLIETGQALDRPMLALQSDIAMAASFARLFFANFVGLGETMGVSHRLLTVAPAIAAYYYQWSRHSRFARFFLFAAAIAALVLLRFELGRVYATAGWAVFAVGLLVAGQRLEVPDLRWQSYAIAALAFARSWSTNFVAPESMGGAGVRIAVAAVVIASFFACEVLIPRQSGRRGWERHARLFYSLLGAVLLTALLYYEVSGPLLTVAWALEALALLGAGFPLRDRPLRLIGLALFLICILKVFFYDLRQLETLYRILSFIVLGGILVGVSWLYTRFRERIEKFL